MPLATSEVNQPVTNSRTPSISTSPTDSPDIISEMLYHYDDYVVPKEDRERVVLTSLPKHLWLSAGRLDSKIGELNNGRYPKKSRLLTCALMLGLNVISSEPNIAKFIALRRKQALVECSGMLSAISSEMMGKWTVAVPSPFGIMPSRTVFLIGDVHSKFIDLVDEIGIRQNILGALCVSYGLYGQRHLNRDFLQVINKTVCDFDMMINIMTGWGQMIVDYIESGARDEGKRPTNFKWRNLDGSLPSRNGHKKEQVQ